MKRLAKDDSPLLHPRLPPPTAAAPFKSSSSMQQPTSSGSLNLNLRPAPILAALASAVSILITRKWDGDDGGQWQLWRLQRWWKWRIWGWRLMAASSLHFVFLVVFINSTTNYIRGENYENCEVYGQKWGAAVTALWLPEHFPGLSRKKFETKVVFLAFNFYPETSSTSPSREMGLILFKMPTLYTKLVRLFWTTYLAIKTKC